MTRTEWFALVLIMAASILTGAAAWLLFPFETLPLGLALTIGLVSLSTVALFGLVLYRRARPPGRSEPHAPDRLLLQTGLEIAAAPDYACAVKSAVDRVRSLTGAEAAAFCLWDEEHKWWTLQGVGGEREAYDETRRRLMTADHAVQCPIVRVPYRPGHIDNPIVYDNQVLGCMCVAGRRARDFSAGQRDALGSLALQAGLAVRNVHRLEHVGQDAVITERERLARELHDTLAQLLGVVSFKTQTAREYLDQGETGRAGEQLDKLTSVAQDLYLDTRELILGLRSEGMPRRELIPALEAYAARFSDLSGVTTSVQAEDMEGVRLSAAVQLQLVRVVQEALSNVRKHAGASRAHVRLRRFGEMVSLTIEDDGRGFDPDRVMASGARFGLQSMRERVEAVNGTLILRAAPGAGTRVTVDVPLVLRG